MYTLPLCYCWILIVTDFCHQTLLYATRTCVLTCPLSSKYVVPLPVILQRTLLPDSIFLLFFFFLACNDTVQSQLSPPTYFILFLDFSESNLLPLSMLCIELLLKAVDEYILSVLQLEIMCRKNFHCLISLP